MFVWNLLRCEVRPDIADQKWFSRIVFTLPPLPLLLPPPLLLHNLPPLQLLPHHLLPHPLGFQHLQLSCRVSHRTTWEVLCWSLGPFFVLLFPYGVKGFSSDDFPTTFIQFLSVVIGSGVCSTFIFGVHADHGRVFANKGLRVKTLLKSLLSELSLLSLLEFLQVKLLGKFPLFIVIFVLLKLNNDVEDLVGLGLEPIRVHGIKFKRLDSDAEGNLLLLLKLFLGLGHFSASIIGRASGYRFLLVATILLGLLSFKHLLSGSFSFFKLLLLFFSLLGLLFIFLLPELLFLFLLLLVQLLQASSSFLQPPWPSFHFPLA